MLVRLFSLSVAGLVMACGLTLSSARAADCGAPDPENPAFLECYALVLWESAKAKHAKAKEYMASADEIRKQCAEQENRSDEASCSMKSMDLEVEAGFLMQESRNEARQAEALADEFWRLTEGTVPSDEDPENPL